MEQPAPTSPLNSTGLPPAKMLVPTQMATEQMAYTAKQTCKLDHSPQWRYWTKGGHPWSRQHPRGAFRTLVYQ
ncbi:hypothetical protein PCASD_24081 [Puccinia coronata f. sp. avenae]|uniref:Uncharacterized protein n=1 Tax=Puccinia coronata f. sp. avenae TaxID=200324 RepID=A0A2N5SEF8_9BASI|nr:hypothetical protein PCASD_24081 [Puccinia coronata f. sp. avenae]